MAIYEKQVINLFQESMKKLNGVRVQPFPKLKLTTIRDTTVACTNCFGNGWNFVRRSDGSLYMHKCSSCDHGQTYISKDGLSHR